MNVSMNTAEVLAKTTIDRFVPDARMDFQPQQHAGQYDFDLFIAGVASGAVEVTTATDQDLRGTNAAIENPRKGGSFISASKCSNGWIVHPTVGANINRIRNKVDEYLAKIEADGLRRFFFEGDGAAHSSVRRIHQDLGIEAGSTMGWKTPRQICIATPGTGGQVTSTEVAKAALRETQKQDNRSKLRASGKLQRHLFVYVDPANYLPWVSLVDCDPPAGAFHCAKEITDVWVATFTRDKNIVVAWRVRNCSNWRDLGTFGEQTV